MFTNIKDGFKYLRKAINKSSIEDGEYNPNFNLAWLFTPFATAFGLCTYLLKCNWEFLDAFLFSIASFLVWFVAFMLFFTYKAYKINKAKKEKDAEKINRLEGEIDHLKQNLLTQSEIIDKLRVEEGYGFAVRELYIAFSILNQYFYDKRNKTPKTKDEAENEIKDILKSFCNCLSDIYTKKANAKCSVSLKIIDGDFEHRRLESVVTTLDRDQDSALRDLDKNYSGHEHKIFNNTCFHEIVNAYINYEEDSLFYLNPSLSTDISYKTSSLDCQLKNLGKNKKKVVEGLKKQAERSKIWTKYISYKSEVVVPILLANSPFNNGLLGFLCIDSEDENVFNEEYDIPLLKGVTDGIYEIITDFKSLN